MSTLSRMRNATTVLRLLKCLPRMIKVLELRTTIWPAGALCSALALSSLAALAQHGHPLVGTWSGYWQTETDRHRVLLLLEYDGEAITGTWTEGEIEGEDNEVRNWAFEMVAPIVLERRGWTRNTLQIGEELEIEGFLARDGSRLASAATLLILRTGEKHSGTTRQILAE